MLKKKALILSFLFFGLLCQSVIADYTIEVLDPFVVGQNSFTITGSISEITKVAVTKISNGEEEQITYYDSEVYGTPVFFRTSSRLTVFIDLAEVERCRLDTISNDIGSTKYYGNNEYRLCLYSHKRK